MAVPQLKRLVNGFPPRLLRFASGQHVGFVVDKAALKQVFSEYFGSHANYSNHSSIIIITIGLLVDAVPSGTYWTPPPTIPIETINTATLL
jgi:hypothetical protein